VVDWTLARTRQEATIEWRTVGLIALTWTAFGFLTWFWRELTWLVLTPLGAYLVCLHGSLQHEALHGHPTRSALINELLVFPPVSLWFPYRRYKRLHLTHHRNEDLTDPALDPESRYFDPRAWERLPRLLRPLFVANNAMLGRFVLGPLIATIIFVGDEARLMRKGEHEVIEAWALHALGIAIVWFWVSSVCGMSFWQYVLFIAYWGNSLTLMRSYAEHRAHERVGCRTIIVETNPLIGLMFLNNNLHMAHHERPGLAWYKLPAYYREHRERLLEDNCGFVIEGYARLARRWGLKPKEPVAHPLPHTTSAYRQATRN